MTKGFWIGAALAALIAAAPAPSDAADLRIGFQKYGTLTLLKAQGTLDRRLAAEGIKVTWTEFPAGPQLLEGLNVGSIDFGTVGEAPPIFAQAAGAPLLYIAHEPPSPTAEALLVPKDSPITSAAQLKGKKIALNKGSNVHYLLVRGLEAAGLTIKDIEPVYLPPADARAAFERGAVDAWVIWDPFFAAAQKQAQARVLFDGTGLVSNHQFFLATRAYAQANPKVIDQIIAELRGIDKVATETPRQAAEFLAPLVNVVPDTLEIAVRRSNYGLKPLDAATVAEQQKIADTFFHLGLIPKAITIADAVWTPGS